jgi:hypothetical protein
MKAFMFSLAALISATAMTFVLAGEENQQKDQGPRNAGFEKIKSLKGEWKVTKGPEHGVQGGTITYRITAGGSAVLESMFEGTEHEMITTYYVDGDQLSLTHYCMLQNRPHMRAEKQSSADKIVFKCHHEGENAKMEKEMHMHQAVYNFIDANHIKTEWTMFKDGKADPAPHVFELERKK